MGNNKCEKCGERFEENGLVVCDECYLLLKSRPVCVNAQADEFNLNEERK